MDVGCTDCGLPYDDDWVDTVLPNEQWNSMFGECGILCANCIIKRASKMEGIVRAEMKLVFITDITG